MKFFERFLGKKNDFDEYEDIYDNGDDDGIDYSELDGYEFEEDPDENTDYKHCIGFDASEAYESVYDEDGDLVYCDYCNTQIVWKDGQYYCPSCERIISRTEFINYIGANLPGPKCITCDNLYPGCVVCPHDYKLDND